MLPINRVTRWAVRGDGKWGLRMRKVDSYLVSLWGGTGGPLGMTVDMWGGGDAWGWGEGTSGAASVTFPLYSSALPGVEQRRGAR